MKKVIISVSRRTDILAFYSDWLIERIKLGYLYYPNPFSQKPVYIDLSTDAVKSIVFWTRNPKPIFKHLDFIDEKYNKHHYMHLTINGYPKILEKRSPDVDYAISSAEFLAKRYGDNYIQWRFDPIIISSITSYEFIINKFKYIADKLTGITKRCYISFVDLYKKTKMNLSKAEKDYNIKFYEPSVEEQVSLVKEIIDIAKEKKIDVYACAENHLLKIIPELNEAHCVDIEIINKICNEDEKCNYKISPTRFDCSCYESKDIGFYDSCFYGCIYCYANTNPRKFKKNYNLKIEDNIKFW
ncbi:MAG: DUF1848 domain-containing protein [Melioribacter sp.]|uniref:DUF1848 domain-containing protein n=1 Tax=Rosettibacter primus TaxID=3111523 RepID=UPI00247F13DD|nr:DUF1848 domain-containing protein [Melioribacter sp.]